MLEPSSSSNNVILADLIGLSLFDVIILQVLNRHKDPIVRYSLYLEVNQFLRIESSKRDNTLFNKEKNILSTSSFYNSLNNLEQMGLLSFEINKKGKIKQVKSNKNTDTALNLLQKHFLEQSMDMTYEFWHEGAIKILEAIGNKVYDTGLVIWLHEYIDNQIFEFLRYTFPNNFILCEDDFYEALVKQGFQDFNRSILTNSIIREADESFDVVLLTYFNLYFEKLEIDKLTLLKEAKRIVKKNGNLVIANSRKLKETNSKLVNRLIMNYNQSIEHNFSNKSDFESDFKMIGIEKYEIIEFEGFICGIGWVE